MTCGTTTAQCCLPPLASCLVSQQETTTLGSVLYEESRISLCTRGRRCSFNLVCLGTLIFISRSPEARRPGDRRCHIVPTLARRVLVFVGLPTFLHFLVFELTDCRRQLGWSIVQLDRNGQSVRCCRPICP